MIECGWFVAEYGRQPWAVEGVLPTFYAASGLDLYEIVMTRRTDSSALSCTWPI